MFRPALLTPPFRGGGSRGLLLLHLCIRGGGLAVGIEESGVEKVGFVCLPRFLPPSPYTLLPMIYTLIGGESHALRFLPLYR